MEIEKDEIAEMISKAQLRAQKATYLEAKTEFATETYPLLEAMYEMLNERMGEMETAVSELIEAQGSYLQPDIASQILTTIEVGRALVGEVRALLASAVPVPEDVKVRLDAACNAFGVHAEATAVGVNEIVAGPEDEDDEDDGEAEDGDDDDDADEEEGE